MSDSMEIGSEDVVSVPAGLLVPEQAPLVTGAEAALIAAKLECSETETPQEHEVHRAKLEQAYADFVVEQQGFLPNSNPAPPGVTDIESHPTVGLDAGLQ